MNRAIQKNEELEKLKAITERLPEFPQKKTDHFFWSEYDIEHGTCFAFFVFEHPEVSVHRWFNSQGSIQRHTHEELEIIIVYEGKLEIIFEGCKEQTKTLTAGNFCIIPQKCIHKGRFLEDTKYLTITIPATKDYPHGNK